MSNQNISDSQLDELLDQLPRAIIAKRDMWPDIDRALPRNENSRLPMIAVAASLILTLLSTAVSIGLYRHNSTLTEQMLAMQQFDPGFTVQAAALLERKRVGEDGKQVIRENLAIIQMAMEQIHAGLEQQPDNPKLSDKLVDLSRRQGVLANRLAEISL